MPYAPWIYHMLHEYATCYMPHEYATCPMNMPHAHDYTTCPMNATYLTNMPYALWICHMPPWICHMPPWICHTCTYTLWNENRIDIKSFLQDTSTSPRITFFSWVLKCVSSQEASSTGSNFHLFLISTSQRAALEFNETYATSSYNELTNERLTPAIDRNRANVAFSASFFWKLKARYINHCYKCSRLCVWYRHNIIIDLALKVWDTQILGCRITSRMAVDRKGCHNRKNWCQTQLRMRIIGVT